MLKENEVQMNTVLDKEIKKMYKDKCKRDGITMNEKTVDMIKTFIYS